MTGATAISHSFAPYHNHGIRMRNVQNTNAGDAGNKVSIGDWYPASTGTPSQTAYTDYAGLSSNSHTHGMSHTHDGPNHRHSYTVGGGTIDLRVHYVDVIWAVKS